MKKLLGIFVLLATLAYSIPSSASSPVGTSNKFGVGIQLGYPGNGLSFNYYLSPSTSLQINPAFWSDGDWQGFGSRVDFLYWMPTLKTFSFADLVWYAGPGLNFWSWSWNGDNNAANHDSYFSVGIEAAVGIGFKFASIPLDMNLELVPVVRILGDGGVDVNVHVAGVFNIRYYF